MEGECDQPALVDHQPSNAVRIQAKSVVLELAWNEVLDVAVETTGAEVIYQQISAVTNLEGLLMQHGYGHT
jgi:hypothetical protein